MSLKKRIYILFIFFILFEAFLISKGASLLGGIVAPIVYLTTGIGAGCCLLLMERYPSEKDVCHFSRNNRLFTFLNYLLFGGAFATLWFVAYAQYKTRPIIYDRVDLVGSDVIPQIHYFVKRFLANEYPYSPIPIKELDYVLTPTYLPMQWMPYIPAELLHFDYRFVALMILSISFIFFIRSIVKLNLDWRLTAFVSLLPVIFCSYYFTRPISAVKETVEYTVGAYYLILVLSIHHRKWGFIACSLILCILSRYSLVMWLPLFGVFGFYYLKPRTSFKIVLIVIAGIALLYAPFLIKDSSIFVKGYEYYAKASVNEWTTQDWQYPNNKYPYHLNQGLGFALYAYKWVDGGIREKIAFFQKVHLVGLCITVLSLFFYWFKNKARHSFQVISIASLKIYLTIFYSFVVIPYGYLYILPLLVGFGCIVVASKQLKLSSI